MDEDFRFFLKNVLVICSLTLPSHFLAFILISIILCTTNIVYYLGKPISQMNVVINRCHINILSMNKGNLQERNTGKQQLPKYLYKERAFHDGIYGAVCVCFVAIIDMDKQTQSQGLVAHITQRGFGRKLLVCNMKMCSSGRRTEFIMIFKSNATK